MSCNLKDIYEKQIQIKKEELKMFKEERLERMVMNEIDFLLRESVSIMNIINLLDGYYGRKGKNNSELKRLKKWLEQRKNENQAKNFNRKSHYNRDMYY